MDPHPTALPALGSRALFPSLAAGIYLNHAGISPPSALVTAAVQDALGAWAALGSGAFPRFMLQRDRLKEQLSGLIGATARDLALRPNTTQGVIDVAVSLQWRPGERVLTFAGEFPANMTPLAAGRRRAQPSPGAPALRRLRRRQRRRAQPGRRRPARRRRAPHRRERRAVPVGPEDAHRRALGLGPAV